MPFLYKEKALDKKGRFFGTRFNDFPYKRQIMPILDLLGLICYSIAGAMPTFLWVMVSVFMYATVSDRFIDVSEWAIIAMFAFIGTAAYRGKQYYQISNNGGTE